MKKVYWDAYFNVLENRLCHVSAARREKGCKMSVFESEKIDLVGKSQ